MDSLKTWSIKIHYTFNVTKSSSKYVEVKCSNHQSSFPWRVRACYKELYYMWMITIYDGDHTCLNTCFYQDSKMIDSNLISSNIEGSISKEPKLPIKQVLCFANSD